MRRVVQFVVGALPLDERGHRAIDETLADWAHESATAAGALDRAVGTVLALFAVGRTLLILTVRESWRIPVGWTVGRFIPIAILSSLALTIETSASVVSPSLWQSHLNLLGWMALNVAAVAVPWAGLVAIATTSHRRQLPLMGLAVAALATSLMLTGWIGPDSRQYFRESAYLAVAGVPAPHPLTRGLQEMRLGNLVLLALSGTKDWSRGAADVLQLYCALVLASPMMVFLAGRLRWTPWWSRGLAIGSFPVALVLGINGLVDVRWAIVLSFLGSLALTWRVRGRSEPSTSAP